MESIKTQLALKSGERVKCSSESKDDWHFSSLSLFTRNIYLVAREKQRELKLEVKLTQLLIHKYDKLGRDRVGKNEV